MNRRLFVVASLVFVLLALPLWLPDAAQFAGRYDRDAIAQGQWWRLLTAHVVHLGARHTLLNAAAAAILVLLFGHTLNGWRWATIVGVSLLGVDVGLWFLSPGVSWYVGASGVLHGVIAAGALAMLRLRDWRGGVLLALVTSKLVFEQMTSGDLGFAGGLPIVLAAHLYGAVGGATAFLLLELGRPRTE